MGLQEGKAQEMSGKYRINDQVTLKKISPVFLLSPLEIALNILFKIFW